MGAVVMKWVMIWVAVWMLVLCGVCAGAVPHVWSSAQVKEAAAILRAGDDPAQAPEWEEALDSLWALSGVEFGETCGLYEARLGLVYEAVQRNLLGWSDARLRELRVVRDELEAFDCPGMSRATLVVVAQLGLHAMAAGEVEYGRALYRDVIRSEHLDVRTRDWVVFAAAGYEKSDPVRRGLLRVLLSSAEERGDDELMVLGSLLAMLSEDRDMRERGAAVCLERASEIYPGVRGEIFKMLGMGVLGGRGAVGVGEDEVRAATVGFAQSAHRMAREMDADELTDQDVLALVMGATAAVHLDADLGLSMARTASERAPEVFEEDDPRLQGVHLVLGRLARRNGVEVELPAGTPDPARHTGTAFWRVVTSVSPWDESHVGGFVVWLEWREIEGDDGAG